MGGWLVQWHHAPPAPQEEGDWTPSPNDIDIGDQWPDWDPAENQRKVFTCSPSEAMTYLNFQSTDSPPSTESGLLFFVSHIKASERINRPKTLQDMNEAEDFCYFV